MQEIERQLLSTQILVESLADILIQKGILTHEEIEDMCQSRVSQFTEQLNKQSKKSKNKQIKDDTLTPMFMSNQIGEA